MVTHPALRAPLALVFSLLSPLVPAQELFEESIRPVLVERCFACHNPLVLEGGLDLTSAAGFAKGATSGPLLPSEARERSRLLAALSYEEVVKMPPDGRLAPEAIDAFRAWIGMGAPWPDAAPVSASAPSDVTAAFTKEQRSFWAFQTMSDPAPPAVAGSWPLGAIDRFLLAKLDAEGLEPASPAHKLTLLRRVTYDLTGLPPTADEIRNFVSDDSPSAFDAVVERLLASPRYGERWGRHWLDVARYADSTGNDEDVRYPHGWRYRDYVIRAFNEDLPYVRFVQEQVAGDLLPAEDGGEVNVQGIVATGFLALGPKALAQQDKKRMLYDIYDEQLDVVSKAFLGLTVTCARCHDHKFDPIPTRDYYSMVSIFARTESFADDDRRDFSRWSRPLVPEPIYEIHRRSQNLILHREADLQNVVDEALARRNERMVPEIDAYMLASERVHGGGEVSEAVASETGLDPDLLESWVAYLAPREFPRPHMAAWREASPRARPDVARAYRDEYRARLSEWNAKIGERWNEILAARPEMDEPPPRRRPEILPGEVRFFYDVHFDEDGPLAVPEDDYENAFSAETIARLRELEEQLAALEKAAPPTPPMASAVAEGEPVLQKVFLRGDYRTPGEDAPMGFLSILEDDAPLPELSTSGRLELAQWLTAPEHPLTARVMVNRVWQWHFGEGLVRTSSNFGKMGEVPSHPELLDYLARRFVASGWSIKDLHRRILRSSAYRMSSDISPEAHLRDPENRFLSHFNRRRLDVEEIRDGLLAIDGSLDFTMGGTLDDRVGTDPENSNERLSLDPSTLRRRTVYLPLRRANLPTLLGLFDFGDAVNSVAKRSSTNVPPQALFMMNSKFVAERAGNLAASLLEETDGDVPRRIHRAYLAILNRPATGEEIESGSGYVERLMIRFPGVLAERGAWKSLCKILMASNEFIYVD